MIRSKDHRDTSQPGSKFQEVYNFWHWQQIELLFDDLFQCNKWD
jgi:hypothetical protein